MMRRRINVRKALLPLALFLALFAGLYLLLQSQRRLAPPATKTLTASEIQSALIQFKTESSGNVLETAARMRFFSRCFNKLPDTLLEQSARSKLEQLLFPWLKVHKNVTELQGSGRGIVMTSGHKLLPFMIHCLTVIRTLLNCTLPVEIFYLGEGDLDANSLRYLNAMPNVTTTDITMVFDMEILKLKGWDVKPFAMLASSFREVLLLDADSVFMQNPELLFDDSGYAETGALFFIDRKFAVKQNDYSSWFTKIVPRPFSQELKNTDMYRGKSNYQQESGAVLIDKGRRLPGLLAACILNGAREKGEVHSKAHGDKETFWLGFEIAQEPYDFFDKQAGAIGTSEIEKSKLIFWSKLAHFDRGGALFWFNDSVIKDKHNITSPLAQFTHISNSGWWNRIVLMPDYVEMMNAEQLALIAAIQNLWNPDPVPKS